MKKVVAVLLVVLMALSFLQVAPGKDVAKAGSQPIWPMLHYNAQRTGQCLYDTSKNDGTLKWKYETGSQIWSSPAIASDGTIYVGADDGTHGDYYLYAIKPNKTIKWKYKSDNPICSSPTIASDGTIYIRITEGATSYQLDLATATFRLCAVNQNGKLKWQIQTDSNIYSPSEYIPVYFSPSVGKDGTVYVGSFDKYFFAVEPNGKIKWKLILALLTDSKIKGHIQSSPVIASNGTIYVGTDFGYLYAINPNGTIRWELKTGTVYSCLAIAKEGTIYVGTTSIQNNLHATYFGPKPSYYLYAIKPNGTIKWKFEVDKPTSPAVAPDGTIYTGSNDGCLYAIGTDSNTSNPDSESNASTQTTIVLQIGNPNITVNGKERPIDEQGSKPIIKNGRTLVPIRAIVEALGGTVVWDANDKKVTVILGNDTIELWIGQFIANVNSVDTLIDSTNSEVVPEIIEGRTMLPLRFVTENLGCDVQWDGITKTITITYQGGS